MNWITTMNAHAKMGMDSRQGRAARFAAIFSLSATTAIRVFALDANTENI